MTDDQPTAGVPEAESPRPQQADGTADKRVRDAQAALTRQFQENARLRARLAEYESDDEDDGGGSSEGDAVDAGEQAPVLSRFRVREPARPRVPEERAIAEQVYDPDVLDAFGRASALLSAAVTEADRVSALEAYHELRSRATSSVRRSEPAGERRTRDEMVTPVVQTNRPDDAGYSSEPSTDRYLGGANGGVGGYVRELLAFRRGGSR